jgi:hypothetical protein
VLVLVLSVTTLGPILHSLHAEACEAPLVLHDASQHRFSNAPAEPGQPATPEHCVACHLQRASRDPGVLKSSAPPVVAASAILRHVDQVFAPDPASIPLPARAPPATA